MRPDFAVPLSTATRPRSANGTQSRDTMWVATQQFIRGWGGLSGGAIVGTIAAAIVVLAAAVIAAVLVGGAAPLPMYLLLRQDQPRPRRLSADPRPSSASPYPSRSCI